MNAVTFLNQLIKNAFVCLWYTDDRSKLVLRY
jgi:hypothetical protein